MIPYRPVAHSPGFYPITSYYLSAVAVLVFTATDFFTLPQGILLLAVAAVAAILMAAWRDLKAVHAMVNGQRHELLTEIADLKDLLRQADVQVPASAAEKRSQTPQHN